jgi:hypothetical protein
MKITNDVAVICTEYARLRCAARTQEGAVSIAMFAAADMLIEMAPKKALKYLDTIKRILEIDPDVVIPNVVLMRASVEPTEAADSITCPFCGRVSYSQEDIRQGYCGACHTWSKEGVR